MNQEKDCLGYFIGIENNHLRFGITPDGKASVIGLSKKGDLLSSNLKIHVDFRVEQVMPDGKFTRCAILPETLESTQAAAADPKLTVIRGKVKGDASFEITVEKSRNGVLLGGKIVEPGTLTANPLRFSIALTFPNVYLNSKKKGDKKIEKAFEDLIDEDRIQLVMADRKKVKLTPSESVDASAKEFNGAGIMEAEISLSPYQGKSFVFAAAPNSSMTFSNSKPGPLHDGFVVTWAGDAAKDANGTARLSIGMK
jgi:hypothetical protein